MRIRTMFYIGLSIALLVFVGCGGDDYDATYTPRPWATSTPSRGASATNTPNRGLATRIRHRLLRVRQMAIRSVTRFSSRTA